LFDLSKPFFNFLLLVTFRSHLERMFALTIILEMRVLAVVNRSKIPVILKELAETYPPPDSATVLSDGLVG